MKIAQILTWNTHAVLDQLYSVCKSGKLRYCLKENLKGLAVPRESINEWLRSDKMDFPKDWDGDLIPFGNEVFKARFEDYLKNEVVDFEPYYFSEKLMEFADGIDGTQEMQLSWLFTENKPKQETKEEVVEQGDDS